MFLLARPGKGLTGGNRCCLAEHVLRHCQGHFFPKIRPGHLLRTVPCHAIALALGLVPDVALTLMDALANHEDEVAQPLITAALCLPCHLCQLQLPCTKTSTHCEEPQAHVKCMRNESLPDLPPVFDVNAHFS